MKIPSGLAEIAERHGGPAVSAIVPRMRPADECLTPEAMNAQKASRLSFTQQLARTMLSNRWKITRKQVNFDATGSGRATYDIDLGTTSVTYILRSFASEGRAENLGRRAGNKRDLWGALFSHKVSAQRIEEEFSIIETRDANTMRSRADVIGWTPGSRSARIFDDVVAALTAGRQPCVEIVRRSGYIVRNGGFLAAGRYGTKSYLGIPDGHPLKSPYFADLFGLLCMREAGIDLVNAMAAAGSAGAVSLSPELSRFFGVGNASGQGMCVALQRWPQWLSVWVLTREFCLARARLMPVLPDGPERLKMIDYLTRAIRYYDSVVPECEEFVVPHTEIIGNLGRIRDMLRDEADPSGTWDDVAQRVYDSVDRESAEIFNALLIEIYPDFADEVAGFIPGAMDRKIDFSPELTVGKFRKTHLAKYDWHLRLDLRNSDARRHFWYHSIENGEQRRGERIIDPHEHFESFIDVIGALQRLASIVATYPDDVPMALVVADFPDLAYVIARVESMSDAPYHEINGNLLDKSFSPAHLIRFYLSILGLESTYPLSIRWVPGVLFQGFPTWDEVAAGAGHDWKFANATSESEPA